MLASPGSIDYGVELQWEIDHGDSFSSTDAVAYDYPAYVRGDNSLGVGASRQAASRTFETGGAFVAAANRRRVRARRDEYRHGRLLGTSTQLAITTTVSSVSATQAATAGNDVTAATAEPPRTRQRMCADTSRVSRRGKSADT